MRQSKGTRRWAASAVAAMLLAGCGAPADPASAPPGSNPTAVPPSPTTTALPAVSRADGRYVPPLVTKSRSCHAVNGLPDAACTPGATDPVVSTATLRTTVCHRGYSAAVRPPLSYTAPIKRERMAAYGVDAPSAAVEFDHLIPISLGGDPHSVANLWPELWDGPLGARAKDHLERKLLDLVCRHQVDLFTAQQAIGTDWVSAYQRDVA